MRCYPSILQCCIRITISTHEININSIKYQKAHEIKIPLFNRCTCFKLWLKCFFFILGNEVPSQHCCQVPWKPDVISVCDWQSLGCEDHRLGFARLQGWTGKSQCKPKEGLYRYIFRKKHVKMTSPKTKEWEQFCFCLPTLYHFQWGRVERCVTCNWNVSWQQR